MTRSPDKPAGLETPSENVDLYHVFHLVHANTINAVLTPYELTKNLSVNVYIDKAERGTAALIDSGAMGNFIHEDVVKQLNLTRTPRTPLPLLDVKGIWIGELLHQVTLHMRIGAHEE